MEKTADDDWIENARMITGSLAALVPPDGSLERVRAQRFVSPGYDRSVMAQAAELGLPLMRIAQDQGGLGLGLRETCEVMRVLGGGLLPEPVPSTILAGALLQSALPDAAMTGEAVIVVAWQDRTGATAWQGDLRAGRLHGEKLHVSGAAGADLFAVTTAGGVAIVPRDADGLTIDLTEMLDGCLQGRLQFDGVKPLALVPADIGAVLQDGTLAHSAWLLGLSERAFEITLDYLRLREQFGRPIGSFQALQHRATELKIQLELARAAISATARRFDHGCDALTRAQGAARCKLRAASLALLVAKEAVQMHGAMGITDEADIALFVRKAMVEANLFGSPAAQRRTLADLLDEVAA